MPLNGATANVDHFQGNVFFKCEYIENDEN